MFNAHYGAIFCKLSLESMFPLGLGDQALGSPIYFGKATNVWHPKLQSQQANSGLKSCNLMLVWLETLDLVQENADFWLRGMKRKLNDLGKNPLIAPRTFFFFLKLLFLWIENSQPAWAGKLLFLAKAYADICLYLAPTKSCGKIKSWRQPAVPFPHSDSPHSASGGDGKMSITVQSAGMTAKWY